MSNKALSWVFESDTTKSSDRLMLLAIADYANEEGTCYASVARLSQKCNITPRSAQKLIKNLEACGEIGVVQNGGKDFGNDKTNLYVMVRYCKTALNIDTTAHVLRDTPVTDDTLTQVVTKVVTQDLSSDDDARDSKPDTEQGTTSSKPKQKPVSPFIQAIMDEWGYSQGRAQQMASVLAGRKSKGKLAAFNVDEPFKDADEVRAFCAWYRTSTGLALPSAEKVAGHAAKWRASKAVQQRKAKTVEAIATPDLTAAERRAVIEQTKDAAQWTS